ncbi:glutathione reductase, chloroplastic, partial [Tanacetum coccineum]
CVLRGCVPKKLLVYASKYSHEFEESAGFGCDRFRCFPRSASNPTKIASVGGGYIALEFAGIFNGLQSEIGGSTHGGCRMGKLYTARNILVSVGGRPFIPDIPGREYVIDSDAALDLPSKPTKIAIVGGGYIALEFAGIFNGLQSEMSLKGIEFYTEESPQAVIKSADGSFSLKTNKGTTEGFSYAMFATGRKPNTKTMGVKLDKNGAILFDESSPNHQLGKLV